MFAHRLLRQILRRIAIVLVVANLCLCSPAFGQSSLRPSQKTIPSAFFGITTNRTTDWPSEPFGALGKGTSVNWSYSEPQKGVFNWANLDAWVATAEAHGVDLFFSNDRVPPWAASDRSTCAPTYPGSRVVGCTCDVANIADWDNFITALATRYTTKLIYELWNEPQNSAITPARMAKLASHAYAHIRSVAPQALIMAPSGTSNYMDAYYAAGGPTAVGVITFHAYRSSPEAILEDVNKMRAVMAKYELSSKPLWDTEGSWGIAHLTSAEQSGFVARYYLLQWSAEVARSYWYAWDDSAWGTLWDSTGGAHPAAEAYREVFNWMVGATMSSPCSVASDSTWTCTLTRPDGYQPLAVWNPTTIKPYQPARQYKQYLDLAGNRNPVTGSVTIGSNPILLLTANPPHATTDSR